MLKCNRSFHVRSAVINRARHGKQSVVDGSRLRVVFSLTGRDHFDEWFWCETAISHQGTIHIEHRVKQILVVTGENLKIGPFATDDWDLGVPAAHIANAVFHGEDAR